MLRGIVPALVTPFDDGRVDEAAVRFNIERYETVGASGYLVLGSTGEAVLLDEEERGLVLRAARAAIPSSKPMIAGVGAESTAAAIRQARAAAAAGADLILVGMPHYFRAQLDDEAQRAHLEAVADASPRPILLYNVPKFTGVTLAPALVDRLSRHEKIAGMKESSGDPGYLDEVLPLASERFAILCGAAPMVRTTMRRGAAGAILAAAVAFPEPFVRIARGIDSADPVDELEQAIAGPVRQVAAELGIAGLKAALDTRGLRGGLPRRPLMPLSEDSRRRIDRLIDRLVEAGALRSRKL